MRNMVAASLAAALLTISMGAGAHSLDHVEGQLNEQEPYAQFVDRVAPEFALTDSEGDRLSLSELRGKVVVLNFIWTHCTDACPLHMNTIKLLQDRVNASGLRDHVQFITIATDTEDLHAARENMRAYRDNFAFDQNWRFLARNDDDPEDVTVKLAEAYGLKFSYTPDGEQVHGVVTHVIDQQGQMRARFHGLKFEHEHFAEYIQAVVEGPKQSPGFWKRINAYFESVF